MAWELRAPPHRTASDRAAVWGRSPVWADRSTWLFGLLVLLMLLPAACVLWFMNEAVTTRSAAAQRSVLEAYRGQLRLVRPRIDAHWQALAARLRVAGDPQQGFSRLILDEVAESIVLFNPEGTPAYPTPRVGTGDPDPPSALAAAYDRLRATPPPEPDARQRSLDRLAAVLNDYVVSMASAERLRLMGELRALAPNVNLPTEDALRLATQWMGAGAIAPAPGMFHESPMGDIWALASEDRRVVALYRTGRLEAMMHDLLHEVAPEGIRFIAFPPRGGSDGEAIAASPWLPGWQLSFVPLSATAFDDEVRRQVTPYVWVGLAGIVAIAMLGATVGQGLRRHMRLTQLKTDLVSAVSHELRTPLSSMQVLVDGLLSDAELDPVKTREYLQMMAVENARLGRLIQNFLTFARFERGRHRFAFAPTRPAAIVAAAVEAMRDRLPPASHLRVEVAPDLPPVMADPDALGTALVNLLDNALKYTPEEKRIAIRASRDGEAFVSFVVEDNGIGIPLSEQRRIFRRFYRVDRRLARDTGGVGLGLSIVDLIVRAHGGTVIVRSEPGTGSTFTLRVPRAGEEARA